MGVLSLGLGSGPWAGGRAQGLGWAEQQEEKQATDSLTSCSVRPGPAPPAWRRHALDGKGARMPLTDTCRPHTPPTLAHAGPLQSTHSVVHMRVCV